MSTRANIKLTFGDNQLWLYAHHDGYPEHRGVDLAKALQSAWYKTSKQEDWFYNEVVRRLATNLVQDVNQEAGDKYEITNSEHGDIEYLYEISANPDWLTGLHFQVSEVSRDEYGDNEHRNFYSVWVGAEETSIETVIESMKLGTSNFNLGGQVNG